MNKHIIFLMAAILLSVSVFAQHNEEVTVEGTYRPKVNKVDKIRLTPEKPQPTFEMPSSDVQPKITDRKFDIELERLKATPYSDKNESLVKPTENFLMAGLGTRISPLFLYRHDSQLTKDVNLGVGINHFSSWLNMKDHPNSGFMNNLFDVRVGAKLANYQLDGKVYFKNDMYHYYGYQLSDSLIPANRIDEFCPKQIYNTIGLDLGLGSTDTHLQTLQHSLGLGYRYTFSKLGTSEHFVDLDGKLAYADSWWGDRSYPQQVGLDLGFQYDYFCEPDFEMPMVGFDRILLKVNPYFEMKDDFYKLHLGARFDYTSADSVKVCFRPDVQGSLYVFDKKLEFYAGLGGGKQLLTFSEIIEENPFVGTNLPLLYRNVKLSFEAGVRTTVAEKVDLHAGVRYRNVANDYFYVMDESCPASIYNVFNQYTFLYDNTETVSVTADARCKIVDNLDAELSLTYNSCKTEVEEYAWYRPAFEGDLKLKYDFNENLALNASLMYRGGLYAKVLKGYGLYDPEKLKDVVDLSLGTDYKLSDQLYVFAKIDNIANCRYQMFYDYPVTGIQVFAGVKMKF